LTVWMPKASFAVTSSMSTTHNNESAQEQGGTSRIPGWSGTCANESPVPRILALPTLHKANAKQSLAAQEPIKKISLHREMYLDSTKQQRQEQAART
jgi:hypothetical protein